MNWCLLGFIKLLDNLDIFMVVTSSNFLGVVHHLNSVISLCTFAIGRDTPIVELVVVYEVDELADFFRFGLLFLLVHHFQLANAVASLPPVQRPLLIEFSLIVKHSVVRKLSRTMAGRLRLPILLFCGVLLLNGRWHIFHVSLLRNLELM